MTTFPFPVERNILLKNFSTFRIGGPAKFFKRIRSYEDALSLFSFLSQEPIPYFILGKGSNCLFDDRGFNGLVIFNQLSHYSQLNETTFEAQSGFSFSTLGRLTSRLGLHGLEFASGIPGSVGGAVFMNAGAEGFCTAQTILSVRSVDSQGTLNTYDKKDLLFSYRTSRFQQFPEFILSATFSLSPCPLAKDRALSFRKKRLLSQPYSIPSAGCIFQNPPQESAGRLIDLYGLKGTRIGGAMISDIHANFIVNTGNASSQDVLQLISLIKNRAHQDGLSLVEEVRYVPFNPSAS